MVADLANPELAFSKSVVKADCSVFQQFMQDCSAHDLMLENPQYFASGK